MTQREIDSPIEEIHRIRQEISERFDGDVKAIAEDAARRLAESDSPIWNPQQSSQALGH